MCHSLSLIALALPLTLVAQPEMGVVARSDGAEYAFNAIPCVTVTPGRKLIATWTAHRAGPHLKPRIVGALSPDGGRTWSAPFPLIDNPGKTDADPSIV